MNRIVRSFLVVLLLCVYTYALGFAVLWNERRNVRQEDLKLSGWGILFIAGVLIMLAGAWFAYKLAKADYNKLSVAAAMVVAATLVLGIIYVAPEIGWESSLRLLGIIAVGLAVVSAHIYLAVSDRHSS